VLDNVRSFSQENTGVSEKGQDADCHFHLDASEILVKHKLNVVTQVAILAILFRKGKKIIFYQLSILLFYQLNNIICNCLKSICVY
jgi:hypothetical protein